MTAILGISAFYHDSAAALVVDGRIVAAAQEERFTRVKHDDRFPVHAIQYCLEEAGLERGTTRLRRLLRQTAAEVRAAAGDLPGLRAGRASARSAEAMPVWLSQKLHLPREIRKGLGGKYRRRCVFTEHHESHAASAFFPSPFDEAAILTLDGVGEWATASLGYGRGNRITLTDELRFPHSLGLLYSAFTYFCGFRVNSGEYKLMGLAPYGEPVYAETIREKLIDLKEDGSFRMDMSYFRYCQGLVMTSPKFARLFGGPPRRPEAPLDPAGNGPGRLDPAGDRRDHAPLRAALARADGHEEPLPGRRRGAELRGQRADSARRAVRETLDPTGGRRRRRRAGHGAVHLAPTAGQPAHALSVRLATRLAAGAAIQRRRNPQACSTASGPSIDLSRAKTNLCGHVADLIAAEKVVGWVQGRMEFGPRALGGRSILGDARSPEMQAVMNLKIKFRESFRPFAPIVLRERASEYFDLKPGEESPYMLLVAPVAERQRIAVPSTAAPRPGKTQGGPQRDSGRHARRLTRPASRRSTPSGTAGFIGLLKVFEAKTGCPVMINTSFNVRGEPIVCRPEDAYRCFMATNMDVLVLERFVLTKGEQPNAQEHTINQYLTRFAPD